ncbi:hypothetical protein, conserved [Eimeria necatrix]|uniref:Uncharacterized protein n=1 Tax=Eimeria necatrix TaxID=51315 RepID=U6N7R7_9EIME|nr:hypothetical protein, conserved [Eimeria necatrix]CDJ69936.1 hypothetical protein, conserved [Eimeria necatrix]
MQTCSARGCIPSLSLALGETVEIEVYVHSALLLPLPLDAVAVRLSGVPAAAQGISQPSSAAAAAAAATSELSGWLVVTSASLQQQQQQHEQQQELPHPQELVLHPGVNALRLLWCCCQPGLFLVEQICFLLNDIVFVQWAGDLPPPALLPRVAAAMERALVGVSGASAAVAAAASVNTNAATNSLSDERNDSSSSSSSSSVPALSEAAAETAAAAARPCANPYYVREDAGDQLSAAAFAERLYGDPRTFAVSSCSPAGATLLHPCAALERLLHPLMLEYRHSSSCVAVQVDPLLPQQHHMLLQRLKNLQQQQQQQEHVTGDLLQGSTNVLLEGVQSSLLLTINVPWGFVDGGAPRLRVLQALSVGAPSSCSSSVEDEEEAVESLSASELQTLPTESFSDAKGTPAAASAHGAPKGVATRAATHVAFGRMQQSSSRDSGSWSCNEASSTPGAAGAAAAQEAGSCLQAAPSWGHQASHVQRTACSSCCSTFSFPRPLQLLIDWEGALCLSIDGSPSVFPLSQFKQDPTGQAVAPTAAATATAATADSKASRFEVHQVQQEIICDSEGAEVVVAVPRLSSGGNSSSSRSSNSRSSSNSSSDEEELGWIPLPPFRSCVQLLLPVCVSCAPGWGLTGGPALQQMHTGDSFYPRGEWLLPADAAGESPLSASRMQWRFQGSCGACEDMKGPSSDSALSGGPSGASRCRCSSISISDSLSRSRPTRAPPAAAVGRGLVTVATALAFTCRKRLPAAADAAAATAASTTTPAAHNEDEDWHELGMFPAAVALDGVNDAEDAAEEAESMQRHSSRSNCAPSSSSKTSSSSSGEPELMVIRLHSVEVSAALTHCISLSRVSDALQVVQVLLKAASAADRLVLVSASIRPRQQQQQQQQDELQLGAPSVSLIAPPDPLSNEAVAQIGESVTLGSRLPPGAVQTLLVKVQYPLPSYGVFSLPTKNKSGSSSNSGDSNSSSNNSSSSSSNSSSSNSSSSNSPSMAFYDLVVSYEVDGGNLGSSVPECCGSLGGLSYAQLSSSGSSSSSNCSDSSRSSLSYVIPLQLPARAPPLLTALDCPRTGRVGSALCVQLRITNTTHEAMEICHRVCLEFDRQDPPGSQVRGGPPGTPGALEKRRQRASGGTQTPAKSPRVGECHDWLMAGSKCRAVLLEGGRSTTVSFSAIPLRAGSLCLPFVRLLYRRAPPGGACEGLGAWGGPLGPSAVAASALVRGPLAAAGNRGAAADACSSPEASPWVPLHGGESLTAGREVLVLPKLVSTPEVRLLQDYTC